MALNTKDLPFMGPLLSRFAGWSSNPLMGRRCPFAVDYIMISKKLTMYSNTNKPEA
jgi:hypothetical protein